MNESASAPVIPTEMAVRFASKVMAVWTSPLAILVTAFFGDTVAPTFDAEYLQLPYVPVKG